MGGVKLTQAGIIKTITGILDKIIRDNRNSLLDGDFKVSPGYGYDKFYLDHVNGSYDMSLQGLIHYIMFEKKIYEQILNKKQYTSLLGTIKKDPEAIYGPGEGTDADHRIQELLDAVYFQCIAYVGMSLDDMDLDVRSTFSDYLKVKQIPGADMKIEPVSGSFRDLRDGKVYKTVTIDKQTWLAENLDAGTFRNGEAIPEARTDKEWKKAGNEGKSVWCYYRYEWRFFCKGNFYGMKFPLRISRFGRLYNWFAVNDERGLAPVGWKVPEHKDWSELIRKLGGEAIAGNKMKSVNGWKNGGNGTDISGFSAIPGGERFQVGRFCYGGRSSCWWSATGKGISAWHMLLSSNFDEVKKDDSDKKNGFYVRCLRK